MSQKCDLVREYLFHLRVEKGLAKNSVESYERDLAKLQTWAEKNDLDIVHLDSFKISIKKDSTEIIAHSKTYGEEIFLSLFQS